MITESEFCEKYYPDILRYMKMHTASKEDAEDLTQIVFLKCISKFDGCTEDAHKQKNWVYTIAGNTLKDYYRKQASYMQVDIEEVEEIQDNTMQDALSCIATEMALTKLSATERQLVLGYYIHGKTLNHLATEHRSNRWAIKAHITGALKQMHNELVEV